MKVKLTRKHGGGFGGAGQVFKESVVELAEGAEMPDGAVEVDEATPLQDWTVKPNE